MHGERCTRRSNDTSRVVTQIVRNTQVRARCAAGWPGCSGPHVLTGAPALSTEYANQSGLAPDLGLAETWLTVARSNSVSLEFGGMGCGCARGCAGGERAMTARSGPAQGSGLHPAKAWGARAVRAGGARWAGRVWHQEAGRECEDVRPVFSNRCSF